MLKPGMMLCDRYEILEVVGEGGMSIVYKARCHRLNRDVAIKVLKSEYSNDRNFVTKFRIEAQAAAGLTHPNIVNVYDVCDDNGLYFIVMELIEGITLKQYIEQNGRLSMDKALDFSIQIASGLEAAHEKHVIHRDVKPQNIIVSRNGNVKVTDFGIAKAATTNTLTSSAVGSVHYISPEQARGGYSDERSDIYSLGITMYEMITARVPFEGDNNVSVALMHIQNDIISPRQYYPDIFPSFEKIVLKATQKKPERRYLTANALIADLRRVQNNPNIDIIVAASAISNSPTQEWTKEDLDAIRSVSSQKPEAFDNNPPLQNNMGELQPVGGYGVESVNDRINQIMDDDSWDDVFEDEYQDRQRGGIKKVQDYDDDEEYDEAEIDPKLKNAIVIAGIAAAVIIAIVVIVILGNFMGWFKFGDKDGKSTTSTNSSSEETVKIPMIEVKGYSETAAVDLLKNAGFTNIEIEKVTDTTVQEGYVINQSVSVDELIESDDKIILTVSSGAEMKAIPDVKGYEDAQACVILEEAGFVVTHKFSYDDNIEKDCVISQSPEGNTEAAAGSTVTITVSNGPENVEVTVPNLYNLTEADAIASLESLELRPGTVTHETSDTVDEGRIISQSIPSGTAAKQGDSISYVVSDGKAETVTTYTAEITGTVTCNDPALEGQAVTVRVLFNGNVVNETPFSGLTTGSTSSFEASVPNLTSRTGTASVVVIDGAGNNVTQSFTAQNNVDYTTVTQ